MLINEALLKKAQALGELLNTLQARVVTAESCTGGAVAAALTAVEGSSAWFDAGFVTYSNSMKEQLLGVSPALIARYGVVSDAVVKAMVEGACHKACAHYGIAISGIAGPAGGSTTKPVGTVYIAWGNQKHVVAQAFYFKGNRDSIREQATQAALLVLTQHLQALSFQPVKSTV